MFSSLYHHEIFRSYYYWQTWYPCKSQGQRSRSQRSKVEVPEVKPQLSRFWTVTPVWIPIWWWNDAKNFMLLRRGALLFFKVIHQMSNFKVTRLKKSSFFFTQIGCFRTVTPVWIHQWLQKWCTKPKVAKRRCPIVFQSHLSNLKVSWDQKIFDF